MVTSLPVVLLESLTVEQFFLPNDMLMKTLLMALVVEFL